MFYLCFLENGKFNTIFNIWDMVGSQPSLCVILVGSLSKTCNRNRRMVDFLRRMVVIELSGLLSSWEVPGCPPTEPPAQCAPKLVAHTQPSGTAPASGQLLLVLRDGWQDFLHCSILLPVTQDRKRCWPSPSFLLIR